MRKKKRKSDKKNKLIDTRCKSYVKTVKDKASTLTRRWIILKVGYKYLTSLTVILVTKVKPKLSILLLLTNSATEPLNFDFDDALLQKKT